MRKAVFSGNVSVSIVQWRLHAVSLRDFFVTMPTNPHIFKFHSRYHVTTLIVLLLLFSVSVCS